MVSARSLSVDSTEDAVATEQNWATAGEHLARSQYNEKIIEAKERQLQETIAQNYSRIKGVEKELKGLQLQLKLTSGPKRSALEHLRKKIEFQNERVVAARERFHSARKVADVAEESFRTEDRMKEQLCQELNLLVQQSAHAQLDKLEQLTQRLELLNHGEPLPQGQNPASLQAEIRHVAAKAGVPTPAIASGAQPQAAQQSHIPAATHSHSGQASPSRSQESAASLPDLASAASSQSNLSLPDEEIQAAAQHQATARQAAADARARHVRLGSRAPGTGTNGSSSSSSSLAGAGNQPPATQPSQSRAGANSRGVQGRGPAQLSGNQQFRGFDS
ncbi:hypothetical protein WJX74_001542 [Apatococcus lobatus]|uniref:RAB6-interacting golgin n=1 Tax=Apatococcus lobatus TaxID=904363 RepID=A0AAW1RL60_9CHLO